MWRTPSFRIRSGIVAGSVLLITAIAGNASPVYAAQTWAVLVGVSEYRYRNQITPLGGAANDARALKRILHDRLRIPDDHIQLLVAEPGGSSNGEESKPDRSEILNALERLRYSVKPDDTIWLFFAGHGVSVKGQTYLLPYDASNLSDSSLVNTALRVDEIKSVLNAIPARARILMFDMCRSDPRSGDRGVGSINPLTPGIVRSLDFTPPPPKTTKPTKPPITITLFACSPGQRSYEWENKGRGFFSYYLEEGLGGKAANKQRQITVDGLAYYVRKNVKEAVATRLNRAQVPLSSLGGPGAAAYVVTTVPPGSVAWVPGSGKPEPESNPSGTGSNGASTGNNGTGSSGTLPENGVVNNGGGANAAGSFTSASGTPFPALDRQSARVEFYSNDPTITATINGNEVTSGGARTEPVTGDRKQFQFQVKAADVNSNIYSFDMRPGDTIARQTLRMHGKVVTFNWPSFADFSKIPIVEGKGGDQAAKRGISAGDWEFRDFRLSVEDQFTQKLYDGHHSISGQDAAHSDTPQHLIVVDGQITNNSKEYRGWYALRAEGGATDFPYEESVLTDKNGKTYPLIAHDADTARGETDKDLLANFKKGERRPARWVFRVPRDISEKDIKSIRLSLLWVPGEGGQIPQRTQFFIYYK